MIETTGAPFELGHAQGRACAVEIARAAAELRSDYGPLSWWWVRSENHYSSARRMQCFTPQLHERLEGIAAGAGVGVRDLELLQSHSRAAGVGSLNGAVLEARFEIPDRMERSLVLRRSRPDACGFSSVELACATGAGCLAGINDQGIGAVVLEDRSLGAPSLCVLAQDFVFRAQALDAGLEHLKQRASYAEPSGVLLAVDASGRCVRVEFDSGRAEVSEFAPSTAAVAESTVRIDAAARSIEWWCDPRDGPARRCQSAVAIAEHDSGDPR